MSVEYTEYVRGKREHSSIIDSGKLFTEYGNGLQKDCFYPIVPTVDEDDVFPLDLIHKLPKMEVKVCEAPGRDPVKKVLNVEGDWGYEITITDGVVQ